MRDVAPAHFFKSQAIEEAAGVANFDPVFVNGDLDVVRVAPVAVAKGVDEIAIKIRSVAQRHDVTVLESPKLARSLHAHTDIGEEIPQALYLAVAEILAFVFELKDYKYSAKTYPTQPNEQNVPDDLDPLKPIKSATSAA